MKCMPKGQRPSPRPPGHVRRQVSFAAMQQLVGKDIACVKTREEMLKVCRV